MKIEAGKYYKARDGRKVGPMSKWDENVEHPWQIGDYDTTSIYSENGDIWRDDGTSEYFGEHGHLIAEWDGLDEISKMCRENHKSLINTPYEEPDATPNYAALAAQHGIKITVQVGEMIVEYDGREV